MTREYHDILYTVQDQVATITLNNAERGNAITPSMMNEVLDAVAASESNTQVRVLVFTGSGKHFCTGMDLGFKNQQELAQQIASGAASQLALNFFNTLRTTKKPTIAKINGTTMGGGWGLAFCLDLRVAVSTATFTFSEVKSGLIPAVISSFIVPQTGPFIAKDLMLTGRKIDAQEALRLHLINAVASESELNNVVQKYVQECVANGPNAMRSVKELVDYVSTHETEQNVEYVKKAFKSMFNAESSYGIKMFAQKKKPDWTMFTSKL